jgi:hypothetical protein
VLVMLEIDRTVETIPVNMLGRRGRLMHYLGRRPPRKSRSSTTLTAVPATRTWQTRNEACMKPDSPHHDALCGCSDMLGDNNQKASPHIARAERAQKCGRCMQMTCLLATCLCAHTSKR